MAHQHLF